VGRSPWTAPDALVRLPASPGGPLPRPSALFLSAESPYPAIGGGPLRSASLLEFLAQRYDVDVTLFNEKQSPDPRIFFPGGRVRRISVIDLPYHSKSTLARYGRGAWRLAANRPPLLDRFSGFERQIATAVGRETYDLAVVEHIWCAPYIKQIRPLARRVLLDAHNIESVWHDRVARTGGALQAIAFRRFARACRRFERHWLPQFDAVIVTSEEDAKHAAGARTVIYHNAMPSVDRPVRKEEEVIVFTGNLEYQPNITAVEHFHEKIWPLLRERVPDLVWRIAGKNPDGIARFINGDARIHVIGPMEDAIATLASAKVAVVPLLSGSGTRFKIIEAWAAGTPVVSTRLGAEGLPYNAGEHLLICDDPGEFAEAVAFLLEAPEARAQLAEAGRRLYETSFTWDVAWSTLDRELSGLYKELTVKE
jgi:glycosyltransferase involved in cell wall biosynthesis